MTMTMIILEIWPLRHWLHLWQLRTWIHDNLHGRTIISDTGQHSQFLRCLSYFLPDSTVLLYYTSVKVMVMMITGMPSWFITITPVTFLLIWILFSTWPWYGWEIFTNFWRGRVFILKETIWFENRNFKEFICLLLPKRSLLSWRDFSWIFVFPLNLIFWINKKNFYLL